MYPSAVEALGTEAAAVMEDGKPLHEVLMLTAGWRKDTGGQMEKLYTLINVI